MGQKFYSGLITKSLFDDIYRLRRQNTEDKSFMLYYHKKLDNYKHEYSLQKSLEIEIGMVKNFRRRKIYRLLLSNMYSAWAYLRSKKSRVINIQDILEVNNLVNNDLTADAGFRTGNAWIQGATHPTVAAHKIQQELTTVFNVLANSNISVIERAFLYHFHIARIHPFIDGNGRTARLIQDYKLLINDFPPAGIPLHERAQYISLLDSACCAYIDLKNEFDDKAYVSRIDYPHEYLILNNSRKEIVGLMDFLAEKVKYNLEEILGLVR